MAWKDTLLQASFRGTQFEIESHTLSGGRRGQLHEYALRDTPYFEDLGRKTREFSIECFIVGDDYNIRRDALIAACEAAGIGTLVHPYLGTKQVVCTDFSISERINEQRICRFNITLTEAGVNLFPSGVTDVFSKVSSLSALASGANVTDFLAAYSSAGLPSFAFDGAQSAATSFASIMSGLTSDADLTTAVGDFTANIGTLMRAPSTFASSIVGLIDTLRTTIAPRTRDSKTAKSVIYAMQQLTGFNVDAEAGRINQSTPSRVAEVDNMTAVAALVRRTALANESIALPNLKLDSYQSAIAYANDYVARVDAELSTPNSQQAYLPLTNLAAVVSTALTQQAGALPQLTTTQVKEPTPTLRLAYALYADPTKSSDIFARNPDIRHPSFIPPNTDLEVLAR